MPRMLVKVALVIVLGRPEPRSLDDLRDDRLVEVLLSLFGRFARRGFLLGVVEVDSRSVLVPVIRTLAIEGRRVVHVPEGVQQLVVRDLGRVIGHLYRLGVARAATANLLIRRVVAVASRI